MEEKRISVDIDSTNIDEAIAKVQKLNAILDNAIGKYATLHKVALKTEEIMVRVEVARDNIIDCKEKINQLSNELEKTHEKVGLVKTL